MDCADTYRDITNYKGNVFAVIRNGICSKNNGASLSMTHLVLPPRSFSGERYLVESCGDLFLVSRDFTTCLNLIYYDNDCKCFVKREGATEIPFKFEVFKMNNISPSPMVFQWEAVSNLGDRIFVESRLLACEAAVLNSEATAALEIKPEKSSILTGYVKDINLRVVFVLHVAFWQGLVVRPAESS
ncbi:hypothetical protein GH714_023377 [Hevea brasiliensis]|uniref:KIB1-4 beta-propeller domain-containing protein n=1 Tax=Hevea brasiliensis TaxID=3981 RepID=A0A6A6LRX7_HEVBR|nr:hypothetical protein GH714_023377 [Hevea brasiliensis]